MMPRVCTSLIESSIIERYVYGVFPHPTIWLHFSYKKTRKQNKTNPFEAILLVTAKVSLGSNGTCTAVCLEGISFISILFSLLNSSACYVMQFIVTNHVVLIFFSIPLVKYCVFVLIYLFIYLKKLRIVPFIK